MLHRRERRVLSLCGAVSAASILVFLVNFELGKLNEVHARSRQQYAQIVKLRGSIRSESMLLSEQNRREGEVEAARKGFYAQGEMNLYAFGTLIKNKLAARGLRVIRYQIMDLKDANSLEFSISGSIDSLVLFLKEVSESEKYWTVPSLTLTMRGESGQVDSVFRIGYEVLDF
jgi:hypothetical protein